MRRVTDCPGKRNTSRPVFTAHERSLARAAWGSSTARLSRESFLPFASCGLCLEPAIDPVSCIHGDIFCRECALSNILAQKKEIKRLEKTREQGECEALEEQARRNLEAQERTVREFELTQAGLAVKAGTQAARGKAEVSAKSPVSEELSGHRREKRKREDEQFRLEQGDLERISEQRLSKARKEMEDEKVSFLHQNTHNSLTNPI
jgi:nitric oxide synthase-interacting protein